MLFRQWKIAQIFTLGKHLLAYVLTLSNWSVPNLCFSHLYLITAGLYLHLSFLDGWALHIDYSDDYFLPCTYAPCPAQRVFSP